MAARFRLSVCPHDTAKNLFGWFALNTYLQRMMACGIHFEPADSFLVERQQVLDNDIQVVYANPYSALIFAAKKGHIPVARVVGLRDETLMVVRKDRPIPTEGEVVIASATDKLIVHPLGQTLLPGIGLDPSRVRYQFVGTHPKAAQAVLKGEAHAGFVFNETWRGLSATTKADLDVVGETRDGTAFHCFCVSPEWADQAEQVRQILVGMNTDPKGKNVLTDLGFSALEAIDVADLEPARILMQEAGVI
jgi:phosphonate transport system substrate-binding protein